jgi:hypothetical protein
MISAPTKDTQTFGISMCSPPWRRASATTEPRHYDPSPTGLRQRPASKYRSNPRDDENSNLFATCLVLKTISNARATPAAGLSLLSPLTPAGGFVAGAGTVGELPLSARGFGRRQQASIFSPAFSNRKNRQRRFRHLCVTPTPTPRREHRRGCRGTPCGRRARAASPG